MPRSDSSSLRLSLSFIFLPSLAFDCFSGVYHIELLSLSRKPYYFFSSLSQLINNRQSTSLDRSTSCLRQAAEASSGTPGGLCAGHITCQTRKVQSPIASYTGVVASSLLIIRVAPYPGRQMCFHGHPQGGVSTAGSPSGEFKAWISSIPTDLCMDNLVCRAAMVRGRPP